MGPCTSHLRHIAPTLSHNLHLLRSTASTIRIFRLATIYCRRLRVDCSFQWWFELQCQRPTFELACVDTHPVTSRHCGKGILSAASNPSSCTTTATETSKDSAITSRFEANLIPGLRRNASSTPFTRNHHSNRQGRENRTWFALQLLVC